MSLVLHSGLQRARRGAAMRGIGAQAGVRYWAESLTVNAQPSGGRKLTILCGMTPPQVRGNRRTDVGSPARTRAGGWMWRSRREFVPPDRCSTIVEEREGQRVRVASGSRRGETPKPWTSKEAALAYLKAKDAKRQTDATDRLLRVAEKWARVVGELKTPIDSRTRRAARAAIDVLLPLAQGDADATRALERLSARCEPSWRGRPPKAKRLFAQMLIRWADHALERRLRALEVLGAAVWVGLENAEPSAEKNKVIDKWRKLCKVPPQGSETERIVAALHPQELETRSWWAGVRGGFEDVAGVWDDALATFFSSRPSSRSGRASAFRRGAGCGSKAKGRSSVKSQSR